MIRILLQPRVSLLVVALLLLPLALASPATHATVLRELTFDELVAESQLIFRGEVLRTDTETADGLVYTRAWFRVDELVAGVAPPADFSLRFVGGDTGTTQVDVAGQYLPAVGEQAVWFVRNPDEPQVNPLTGWQQGVFRVETGADGEQLLDLAAHPELILLNARGDPLVRKMLAVGLPEARIVERFPQYQRFLLDDFLAAIRSVAGAVP